MKNSRRCPFYKVMIETLNRKEIDEQYSIWEYSHLFQLKTHYKLRTIRAIVQNTVLTFQIRGSPYSDVTTEYINKPTVLS